jgi:hypothetical protein
MSLTLSTIRAAIGDQLRANLDREINVDVDGEGKPAPVVRLELDTSDPIDYWLSFGSAGITEVRFALVVDPAGVDQSSVRRLDEFLSVGTGNDSSIIDALLADKTLGGVVETLHVAGVSEYDPEAVTAVLPLRVVCRKQGANA